MAERVDRLHLENYSIIQDSECFCYGIDAVLLSDFIIKNSISSYQDGLVSEKEVFNVCDLGTGNGIIPILLAVQTNKSLSVIGIEIQEKLSDMAERSVKVNHLERIIKIINGDVKNIQKILLEKGFDIVCCNPPYMKPSSGRQSSNTAKMIARQEIKADLDDFVKAAKYLLKPSGQFFMINRANRLDDIFFCLKKYGFNKICFQMVKSFKEKDSSMVLICAEFDEDIKKTKKTDLIIYEAQGQYTEEVKKIYKRQ